MSVDNGPDKKIPQRMFDESHRIADELQAMFNLGDGSVDTKRMDGMLAEFAGPPCSACEVAMIRGKGPDPDHGDCVKAARGRLGE